MLPRCVRSSLDRSSVPPCFPLLRLVRCCRCQPVEQAQCCHRSRLPQPIGLTVVPDRSGGFHVRPHMQPPLARWIGGRARSPKAAAGFPVAHRPARQKSSRPQLGFGRTSSRNVWRLPSVRAIATQHVQRLRPARHTGEAVHKSATGAACAVQFVLTLVALNRPKVYVLWKRHNVAVFRYPKGLNKTDQLRSPRSRLAPQAYPFLRSVFQKRAIRREYQTMGMLGVVRANQFAPGPSCPCGASSQTSMSSPKWHRCARWLASFEPRPPGPGANSLFFAPSHPCARQAQA